MNHASDSLPDNAIVAQDVDKKYITKKTTNHALKNISLNIPRVAHFLVYSALMVQVSRHLFIFLPGSSAKHLVL